MLTCKICGKHCNVINWLHLRTHGESVETYKVKFPEAKLYDEETRQKMKAASRDWHSKNTRPPRTEEQNRIHSEKMTGKRYGPRSEETRQRMRDAWENNRESWAKSIRESANTPERKKTASDAQKKRIARDGYHLARGKETRLELFVRETLENAGYTVTRQKPTKKETLGTVRYFDIYVHELNLIVEADGEWWHRTPDRIAIDIAKTQAAISEGFSFLRISDKDFGKKPSSKDMLITLLNMSQAEMLEYSNSIILRRMSAV